MQKVYKGEEFKHAKDSLWGQHEQMD